MGALNRVNITFSDRCNLACPFCVCSRYQQGGRELTVPEWLEFIDELSANKVFQVGIWGGEPFFMPGLRSIIDRIVAGRMRFHLITNGSCIDEALLRHIAASGRCDYLQFSLDGFEDVHDAGRGKGVFRKVLAGIRLASELKLKVLVNSVISRGNVRETLNFARFLETLDIATYRLNLVSGKRLDLSPTYRPLTMRAFAGLIAELAPHFESLPKMHWSSPAKNYWRQLHSPRFGDAKYRICRAPSVELSVFPDGKIVPCPAAAATVLGFANRDSLADLWNNSAAFGKFQSRLARGSKRNAAGCQDCEYRYYCRKYCPNSSSKYYCRKKIAGFLRSQGVMT